MGIQFTWIDPPTATLSVNLNAYKEAVRTGMLAIMEKFRGIIEEYAKKNAPWNDRTGAARRGLTATIVQAALSATISLAHTVFYGVFLEFGTRYMAPRPIVAVALQANYAPLMSEIRAMMG